MAYEAMKTIPILKAVLPNQPPGRSARARTSSGSIAFFVGGEDMKGTLRERFENKIESGSDGCTLWSGGCNSNGYGQIGFKSKVLLAHRVSWELYRGEIPDGKCVLHRCDNPLCVNPDHLFIGTQLDNMLDRTEKSRAAKGEQHGRSKLTAIEILLIRADNRLHREIATAYGVNRQSISAIKSRKKWRHLPDGNDDALLPLANPLTGFLYCGGALWQR